MKRIWNSRLLLIGLIAICFVVAFHFYKTKQNQLLPTTTAIPDNTNSMYLTRTSKPISDFTDSERAAFDKEFNERLKPAIDKWCNAYAGHLPFNSADVTEDKFHSTLQGGFYNFMLEDATFTVLDNHHGVKVFYFMTKQAAHDLNSIPKNGQPRNLTVPITAKEVIEMVKADTGIEYEPKQIEISPTAAASALDGGAFVEVNKKMLNGMQLILPENLSFIVGADGKLVSYQH